MGDIKINKLPIPTWNWLKVNDKRISLKKYISVMSPVSEEVPEGVTMEADFRDFMNPEFLEMEISAGEELKELIKDSGALSTLYKVSKGTKVAEPIRLTFDYSGIAITDAYLSETEGDANLLSRITFDLEEEAELTCVIFYKGNAVSAINDIRIRAAKKACLTLVEIFETENGTTFIDSIGGSYGEKAGLKLIQIEKGEGDTAIGCLAGLDGYKSYLDIDMGYLVKGSDKLDINYVARHRGKVTDTKINVNGVLRDKASKTFRGTIDFIKGCKDSTGDEREDVLMMDEGVHNNTVPVILCEEEDVEGTHGASIGKISDEILLYFQTRGIPESEVTELMAKSRIDAVAGRIPDEETRKLLLPEE